MSYTIGDRKYALDVDWGKLPDGYEYNQVAGVAVDDEDNVYAFNRSDHKLLVLDREGNLVKVWGQKFDQPHGAHVDRHGNVYLVDRDTHVVEKFSRDEELLLTLGTKGQPSDTGHIDEGFMVEKPGEPHNMPTGVSTAPNGDIFVSDGYGNCRVHKFDSEGNLLCSWGIPGTEEPGEYQLPHGIGVDNEGRVLVCDRENHRIQVIDQDGGHIAIWTGFRQPTSVAFHDDGLVYVPELQARLSVVDRDGNLVGRWGGEESREPGQFVAPHCAAVDSEGSVYVGEVLEGARLQKFVRES